MKHLAIGLVFVSTLLAAISCQSVQAQRLQVLIPLYIYPSHYHPETYVWPQVAAAQQQVAVTAIINPNNGPGGAPPNADYVYGLDSLRSAGVTLLGYVSTQYGERDVSAIQTEIDLYAAHYPVQGIFLDEAASGAAYLDYYHTLSAYIKAKPTLKQVVLNQGTTPDPGYLTRSIADTLVIFENYASVWETYQPPFYGDYPPERFAALIHSLPDASTMQQFLEQAARHNIGYIYITDDTPDGADRDPWNQLPSYWDREVDTIRRINQQIN